MLTVGKSFRRSLLAVLVIVALLLPASAALAQDTGPNPHVIPVIAPRTSPPPIPHSSVLAPNQIGRAHV